MKLIGKYKVGKLRFRWHLDFQMSTSRRGILMNSECGCGRCNRENEKPKNTNTRHVWTKQLKTKVLDTFRIIVDNINKKRIGRYKNNVRNYILGRFNSLPDRKVAKKQLRRESRQ